MHQSIDKTTDQPPPRVQIYPVGHHVDPAERAGVEGLEFAKAVTIGDNVWIGGNAVLMPGGWRLGWARMGTSRVGC